MDIHRKVSKELLDNLADWEEYLKRENLDVDSLLSDLAKGVVTEYVPSYLRRNEPDTLSKLNGFKSSRPKRKRTPRRSVARDAAKASTPPPKSGGPK